MKTYIAMLRGINVSGQKIIKMADFKEHLQELNFSNVQTYIQSGNAVFRHKKENPKVLETKIEKKIYKEYGFDVSVIVKTTDDLKDVLMNNSFTKGKDLTKLYFTFLSDVPQKENLKKLEGIDHNPEEYVVRGTTIYFYSPQGYGKAKLNNNFFENKLKVNATTRNWKTVNILADMANSG